MPNRDYAARSKARKGSNAPLILAMIVLLLAVSGLGLWMLAEKAPTPTPSLGVNQATQQAQQPKATLPSPPEEVYSYIRDLETREIPVDKNSQLAKLTKEQEQQIAKQLEEEQNRLAQQTATESTLTEEVAADTVKIAVKSTEKKVEAVKALTPEEFEAKKLAEQKAAEEKRKQAEKKAQEAKKQETVKATAAKPTEQAKNAKASSDGSKYGLQCGAFKNKAQAENMQARLAMSGFNARISSSGEWNRVFVGPIGDRAAASAAQSNARSVAECLIVGMK